MNSGGLDGVTQLFFSSSGTPLLEPEDVIPYLGRTYHWRQGRSAYEAAKSWFEAQDLPLSIRSVIGTDPAFSAAILVRAVFEKKTELDKLGRPSQTDVLALLRTPRGPAVLGIEAKVDETFGPLVSTWDDGTSGKQQRLAGLLERLGMSRASARDIRYQLLHRTAATLIEAEREGAKDAALIVQSFSPSTIRAGFRDFQAFAAALGTPVEAPDRLSAPLKRGGVDLRLGWAQDRIRIDDEMR